MRQHPWWLSASLLLAGSVGSQTLFTDATGRLGLEFEGRSARNVIFADYDNDGFQTSSSLRTVSPTGRSASSTIRATGARVNQTDLIPGDLHSVDGQGGSVFADYDNDGDQDLYLSASPHNMLLRNDGGRFSKVSVTTTDTLVTDQAIWLDYDRDGLLDLYVSNEFVSENRPPRGNRLFHNDGNGSFSDQTAAAGLDVPLGTDDGGSAGGMAAGDFNNDGWPDLYLGVNRQPNRLFLNDGQGRFRDATTSEIGDEGEAFSIAVGDIDNEGDLDILQPAGASDDEGFRSKMLLNLGGGEFLDVLEAAGLDTLNNSNVGGTLFADFDNDGDLDLVVGTSNRTNLLLLNDGSGFFSEATSISGIKDRGAYIAVGDYDEDGFLDLLYASFTRELTALYRNNGNSNRWLRVELVGIESNRDGIGSRLIATSGDLVQMREILGGVGTPTGREGGTLRTGWTHARGSPRDPLALRPNRCAAEYPRRSEDPRFRGPSGIPSRAAHDLGKCSPRSGRREHDNAVRDPDTSPVVRTKRGSHTCLRRSERLWRRIGRRVGGRRGWHLPIANHPCRERFAGTKAGVGCRRTGHLFGAAFSAAGMVHHRGAGGGSACVRREVRTIVAGEQPVAKESERRPGLGLHPGLVTGRDENPLFVVSWWNGHIPGNARR